MHSDKLAQQFLNFNRFFALLQDLAVSQIQADGLLPWIKAVLFEFVLLLPSQKAYEINRIKLAMF